MGAICTSTSLTPSTGLSPGFSEANHSSSSFGSQQTYYSADLSPEGSWPGDRATVLPVSDLRGPNPLLLSLCVRVFHPNTCTRVALLGPCFKTGQMNKFSQDPSAAERAAHARTCSDGALTQGQSARRASARPRSHSQERRGGFLNWARAAVPPACKCPRGGYLAGGQFRRAQLILCGPTRKVHRPGPFTGPGG